jgi:hypothetical protein
MSKPKKYFYYFYLFVLTTPLIGYLLFLTAVFKSYSLTGHLPKYDVDDHDGALGIFYILADLGLQTMFYGTLLGIFCISFYAWLIRPRRTVLLAMPLIWAGLIYLYLYFDPGGFIEWHMD